MYFINNLNILFLIQDIVFSKLKKKLRISLCTIFGVWLAWIHLCFLKMFNQLLESVAYNSYHISVILIVLLIYPISMSNIFLVLYFEIFSTVLWKYLVWFLIAHNSCIPHPISNCSLIILICTISISFFISVLLFRILNIV